MKHHPVVTDCNDLLKCLLLAAVCGELQQSRMSIPVYHRGQHPNAGTVTWYVWTTRTRGWGEGSTTSVEVSRWRLKLLSSEYMTIILNNIKQKTTIGKLTRFTAMNRWASLSPRPRSEGNRKSRFKWVQHHGQSFRCDLVQSSRVW